MVLLIIGIIISVIVFYRSNFARITDQNENYISDIASQRASLISDLFEENEKYIESAAIATETEFRVYDVDTDNLNTEREEDISEKEINKVASILREPLNSGMNGHIAKPFEPEELAAELQRYISE